LRDIPGSIRVRMLYWVSILPIIYIMLSSGFESKATF
jgi:hypothetical protein